MRAHRQRIDRPRTSSFVYRIKSVSRFEFGWHFHPEVELTYIERSRGKRYVGAVIEDYESGDLVLLGPNLPHTWCSSPAEPADEGSHRAIVVQFRPDFLGEGIFSSPELEAVGRIIEKARRGVVFGGTTRNEVARRLHRMRKQSGWAQLSELLGILDILAASEDARPICDAAYFASPDSASRRRVDRVFRYIHENYTEKLVQPDVAAKAHLSPAAFSRFFKRTFGRTFVNYLTELRLQHACRLLTATDYSIAEVAYRSGFSNLSGFNRHFLRAHERSPRSYRSGPQG